MRSTLCAAAQGGLPLYQSLIGNLYFSTCFKAALHLVLSHTNKWIRPGTRQNLPLTRRWARKTGALGPEYFKSSTATSNEQNFATGSELPVARNGPKSDPFGPLSVVGPSHRCRFSMACANSRMKTQSRSRRIAVRNFGVHTGNLGSTRPSVKLEDHWPVFPEILLECTELLVTWTRARLA